MVATITPPRAEQCGKAGHLGGPSGGRTSAAISRSLVLLPTAASRQPRRAAAHARAFSVPHLLRLAREDSNWFGFLSSRLPSQLHLVVYGSMQ